MLTLRCVLAIGLFAIVLCPRHCAADQGKETTPKIDKFVTVFGAKIPYVEAGRGVPVIKRPTLVLWGRDDKLIPLSFGERFHREIADSRLRIIDNCGHIPQVECPDEYAAAVLEFLTGVN